MISLPGVTEEVLLDEGMADVEDAAVVGVAPLLESICDVGLSLEVTSILEEDDFFFGDGLHPPMRSVVANKESVMVFFISNYYIGEI